MTDAAAPAPAPTHRHAVFAARADETTVDAVVRVRNTGERDAEELVQLYALPEEGLRIEVVSAHGALNQARQNVVTAEQGERAAAAAYEARARLQEQGMGTTLELLQAETARIRARLNLIYAHIALRVARTQLDHAVGRDVPLLANATASR